MMKEGNPYDASVDSIDFVYNENSESIKELKQELNKASPDDLVERPVVATMRRSVASDVSTRSMTQKSSVRVSSLPMEVQNRARELDHNEDGMLSVGDLGIAIHELAKRERSIKSLKRMVLGFIILVVVMTGCIFAASITAARLSKDFVVDSNNGLALVKDTKNQTVMKTRSADNQRDNVSIAELSNEDLGNLKHIILKNGDLRLKVKGYSRDPFHKDNKVVILIEGGTITYDTEGIFQASGNAQRALEVVYGLNSFDEQGYSRLLEAGYDDFTRCSAIFSL